MRTTKRWTAAALATVSILASCTRAETPEVPGPASPSPQDPARVRVAFIEDASGAEAGSDPTPALQAATLAFATAALAGDLPVQVEVVPFDTEGAPGAAPELAAEIGADDAFVAAIVAPFVGGQAALGDALAAEGIPWLSISDRGVGLGARGWPGFRRFVADEDRVGAVLAGYVDGLAGSGADVCLLGDASPESLGLLGAVRGALTVDVALRATVSDDPAATADAVAGIGDAGCRAVVWGGGSSGGAELRRALVDAGLRDVTFVGGDRLLGSGYADEVGPAGRGTVSVCPCVDLSTSTDLAALRFIQDYQAEVGVPPGPYATETWDAARLLTTVLRAGAVGRSAIGAGLDATASYDGLANRYRFDVGGELRPDAASVWQYRLVGGRWMPFSEVP